ncbi:MAG: aminotransferase [Bacteroidetes bacterium GWE2_39_28]|nr:MAG: aminotransferase [Bacteroidetes bacterium GWE2_39_28]OFY13063.1 MAG: aminotransferase [Bacteroidetes bacterium GWF2_39_10]OFZ09129.1 MAG: aminotransferase [Bacteroidetes bacterium RIFOXYB2_FULL_39_7]OFZ12123.1 MAG: aminotransferase [Bacteroidetes bacterium RIFOXYC2_FULL_39_11]HCT94570.1 aminotransferase [Rikenellaceae bacterium]
MDKLSIPFAKVFIGENEHKYIKEVLDSGWLTTAGKALEFEKKFAEYVGAKFACAVNSCTAALHLGIDALGIQPGDKVFVPTMTFTASAEIIRYMQGDPCFLDIEYGTNLITPQILLDGIKKNPDVRFLVIVHYGGQSAHMDEIITICKKSNIKILEDAAHSFPSRLNGKMVGSFGEVACFSFYANKTITTGEGGMLVTDDENLHKRVKTMRLHGINRDIWDRFTSNVPSWEYDVIEAGYKYNMPDINAAIGLGQLEQAEFFRSERQKVAEYYFKHLSDIECIDLPICNVPYNDHAWHLFPIVIKGNSEISRHLFIEKMSEAGIGTSVHYKPLHRMTYYKERYNLSPSDFPNAEKTWMGNVSLPIYPFLKEQELEYICMAIKRILT